MKKSDQVLIAACVPEYKYRVLFQLNDSGHTIPQFTHLPIVSKYFVSSSIRINSLSQLT